MNINLTLVIQGLAFFATAWVVMKFGWPLINSAIEERQKKIADGLAAAEEGQRALAQASEKQDAVIREARGEAAGIRDRAEKEYSAILDKAGISGVAANFIKLVASKRRLFAISDMIAGYRKLEDAANGVTRAEVTAASPLNDKQMQALRDQLAAVAGAKSVDVDVKIDPAIIGGLVVKVGSRMVDSSLKTKLNAIRTRMKEVG